MVLLIISIFNSKKNIKVFALLWLRNWIEDKTLAYVVQDVFNHGDNGSERKSR